MKSPTVVVHRRAPHDCSPAFDPLEARLLLAGDLPWILTDHFTADDGAVNQNFGSAAAIDGDVAVVGALGDQGQEERPTSSSAAARTGFSRPN
jgi:hypothetical protein